MIVTPLFTRRIHMEDEELLEVAQLYKVVDANCDRT
jgi:hypothetical protein